MSISAAILSALDIVLEKYAMKITEKRTKEIYESNKFKGDPNYFISITLPSCARKELDTLLTLLLNLTIHIELVINLSIFSTGCFHLNLHVLYAI